MACVAAELFDLAKNLVELQRVLAQNAALQKQRVSGAGAVPHFSQSIDALISINTNDRTGTGTGLHDRRHAQVRDLERRRTRIGIDYSRRSLQRIVK